jgi:hypothetical protein
VADPTPALIKFTFSFRDLQSGWTESWYGPAVITQAVANLQMANYLNERMPLMGLGIWANFAKATLLNGTGISFKLRPNMYTTTNGQPPRDSDGDPIAGATGVTPVFAGQPDRPYSTLMAGFIAPSGQKNIFLSGIPDDVITDPFGPTFVPGYAPQLVQWQIALVQNGWGWNSRRATNAYAKTPITGVTVGPPATITAPGSAVAAGSLVQVGGFRNLVGYRGQFRVQSNAGGVIELYGYAPPASLTNPIGYIQQVGVGFQGVGAVPPNFTENKHSRGKGLGLLVGRRKRRRN